MRTASVPLPAHGLVANRSPSSLCAPVSVCHQGRRRMSETQLGNRGAMHDRGGTAAVRQILPSALFIQASNPVPGSAMQADEPFVGRPQKCISIKRAACHTAHPCVGSTLPATRCRRWPRWSCPPPAPGGGKAQVMQGRCAVVAGGRVHRAPWRLHCRTGPVRTPAPPASKPPPHQPQPQAAASPHSTSARPRG